MIESSAKLSSIIIFVVWLTVQKHMYHKLQKF